MKLKMVTGIGGSQQPQQNMVPSSAGIVGGNPSPGDGQKRSSGDHRRSNKPIMEKRRRARINNCLNELKTLILDAMKKDPARHSKLEKADILEMTVKHLENLQRQQVAADPTVVNKFRAGFSECAGEVGRFPGLDPAVKRRLLQHLASCLTGSQVPKQDTAQAQVHILPSPPSSPEHANNPAITGGIFLSNGSGTGVQLMPTRLPNGDIALILPSQSATAITSVPVTVSPLPMLIPIPSRTSSTSSASSSMSSSSSSGDSVCTRIVTTVIRPLTQPILEKTPLPSPPICYSPVSPAEREWSPSPDSQRSYSPLPQPSQGRFSPSIDENFRPYSPEQVPLSLVIRRDRPCESEDDKPWRPW